MRLDLRVQIRARGGESQLMLGIGSHGLRLAKHLVLPGRYTSVWYLGCILGRKCDSVGLEGGGRLM